LNIEDPDRKRQGSHIEHRRSWP